MSQHKEIKRVTTHVLQEMKNRGEKISMLTAYDYSMASIVDQAGQLAGTPMMDPEKNPDALDTATQIANAGFNSANQPPQ